MKWTMTVFKNPMYVEIVTIGSADKKSSLEMAKEIAAVMRKNRMKRALIDHTNINSTSGGTAEVYERAKQFSLIGAIMGIKVAEVVKSEHREFFRFLETVSVNRGYTFSTFEDKETALNWLLNG